VRRIFGIAYDLMLREVAKQVILEMLKLNKHEEEGSATYLGPRQKDQVDDE
jgi:hypothetical protein